MGMRTLEAAVLAEARELFKNPKLRQKDILAWSTGNVTPEPGEVVARTEGLQVDVCVKVEHDKRKAEPKATKK